MRTLPRITPTPEQLPLIQDARPGVKIIRGAAGSGKTTTALLRLRQLAGFWLSRREREEIDAPVRALVITFNRTLRGYIADLASQQIIGRANLEMEVLTFAKWALTIIDGVEVIQDGARIAKIESLCRPLGLSVDFLANEVDYVLGRFPTSQLTDYLTCRREGRGNVPRCDRGLRQRLLEEVIRPYADWKQERDVVDWNDLAIQLTTMDDSIGYDIIIADEVQDLSANQIRALMNYANDPSSVTFVLDAAQRIYPRGFTWAEAGVAVTSGDSIRLAKNYRNTKQICRFALPLLEGLEVGDDGTYPDLSSCQIDGAKPIVIKGQYSRQVKYTLDYLEDRVDLSMESVAFLKPKGGNWFSHAL